MSDVDDDALLELESAKLVQRGMPEKIPYENMNPAVLFPVMEIVTLGLGYLAAWGIYSLGGQQDKYDAKIATLKSLDLGYLYLAVLVAVKIQSALQMFVAINRKHSHTDNPDQYVFKTVGRDDLPYVRLEDQGAVGRFNRAQRGIDNFREGYASVLACVLLGGFVFPLPALVAISVMFVARVTYSVLYIQNPAGRGPGFVVALLANLVLTGLVFFAAIKSFL